MAKRITEEQKKEILTLKAKGWKNKEIGNKFGITYQAVNKILKIEKEKPQGLGDVVHKVLHAPLVEPVTKAVKSLVWGEDDDCGCDERRDKLNKMFRFKVHRCMTKEQYLAFREIRLKNKLTNIDRNTMWAMYKDIFNIHARQPACTTCSGAWRAMRDKLEKLYMSYE